MLSKGQEMLSVFCAKAYSLNVIKLSCISVLVFLLLQTNEVEARKLKNNNGRKRIFNSNYQEISRKRSREHPNKRSLQKMNSSPKPKTIYSLGRDYASEAELSKRRQRPPLHRARHHHRNKNPRTEVIKKALLTLPGLSQLLKPIRNHRGNLNGLISSSSSNHLQGTVRKARLYCRIGIGFHLEIKPNGKVFANHKQSLDGIMEIFSISRSVVGIRSGRSKRYLCMNKAGRVFTRKSFRSYCAFRENLERNNFNTYASEQYSDHDTRTGYFLAITKKGKIPKRMKKVSWRQKKAHWLPRAV